MKEEEGRRGDGVRERRKEREEGKEVGKKEGGRHGSKGNGGRTEGRREKILATWVFYLPPAPHRVSLEMFPPCDRCLSLSFSPSTIFIYLRLDSSPVLVPSPCSE